jgi:DNA-binding helix-hairpin-helix protein with protein kinase domain
VTNEAGEFVGYLMPRAGGTTMQKAMFVEPVLEKKFPNWQRWDLVNVAGTFIDHISYLHSLNIIVGDINPLNLLVTEDSTQLWIVDTDTFRSKFPCPV